MKTKNEHFHVGDVVVFSSKDENTFFRGCFGVISEVYGPGEIESKDIVIAKAFFPIPADKRDAPTRGVFAFIHEGMEWDIVNRGSIEPAVEPQTPQQ